VRDLHRKPWLAPALLAIAAAASALLVLRLGKDLALNGAEVFYFAHFVIRDGVVTQLHGVEYFFAPHNGHLVLGGRLVFESLFQLAGTDYLVFRLAEVVGILVSVALFFVLARRCAGPAIALAFCVSLLFLGYANETFLWPFNLHTVYALALGLGALLALERDNRRGDLVACLLLTLSVLTLEVGLAFAVGVAVSVLLRDDRVRRLWIFAVPIALYAAWWLWSRRFGQMETELANLHLVPQAVLEGLASVAGSLTGLNPSGSGAPPGETAVTTAGVIVAAVAGLALLWRFRRGGVPATLWVSLAIVLTYWAQIAMGGRDADSARYVFVAATMVLLVAADALRGVRLPAPAVAAVFVVVALALPANLAKLRDGRDAMLPEADANRAEYAMVDLARERVDPAFVATSDPRVQRAGGAVFVPLAAGPYLEAEDRYGPLGFSLERIRSESPTVRNVADATLVAALGLALRPSSAPANPASCPSVIDASAGDPAFFDLPAGGALLGARGGGVEVGLSRFSAGVYQAPVGRLRTGSWATLKIPPDSAPDPWLAVVSGPVYVCPLP
jgi:hypothetical protein